MHCRASECPIKTHVTDGPYTEWKEVVGGLFVIEADSLDDGLRIASMHPAATLGKEGGWAGELIPMDFYLARQGPRRLSRMGSRLHELLQGFVSRRGGVRSIPAGPCLATGPRRRIRAVRPSAPASAVPRDIAAIQTTADARS